MATLVLSAVGSAVAGPFGSAVGGLIGRQIDQSVFGGGRVEGQRLTELSVTTSSYGQAIPRRFGRTRVAGTIIWSTDLIESTESESRKGQPSRTSYNYSVSFAVAVSSTPIDRIGRVWADGKLLVGAENDLKVGGTIRTYLGKGDEAADPLIEAEQFGVAPAFRDCAYVLFENLNLEEFGNRIPALTFEVFTGADVEITLEDIVSEKVQRSNGTPLPFAKGFSDIGGSVSSSLAAIDQVYPFTAISTPNGVSLAAYDSLPPDIHVLHEGLQDVGGSESGANNRLRGAPNAREPLSLRYYDEERDYQPGVQRAFGRRGDGSEVMLELPATMTAQGAKNLINSQAQRARWRQQQIKRTSAKLDPNILPGAVVMVPKISGLWQVSSWEWNENGVEYTLHRRPPELGPSLGAASGRANIAPDVAVSPTILNAIEVPPQNIANPSQPEIYAAATSESSSWTGASLYVEQGDVLVPLGSTNRGRSTTGFLISSVGPSNACLVEPNAQLEVQLPSDDLGFDDTDLAGLAAGANRLLVGAEVIQFLSAEPQGNGRWKLTGLLRGRAGTEDFAIVGHSSGISVTALNGGLTPLDSMVVQSHELTRIAAIGVADNEATFAPLQNAGLTLRPPSPVHPRNSMLADGTLTCCWTRRARGAWFWQDEAQVPLIEESELYLIGLGPVSLPYKTWRSTENQFTLSASERTQIINEHGGGKLWVKQIGTHARSPALLLTELA